MPDKLNELVDESAIQRQADFVVDQLDRIEARIATLNDVKIKIDGLTSVGEIAKSAAEASKQIGELEEARKKLAKSTADYDALLKRFADSQKRIADLEKQNATINTQLAGSVKKVATSYADMLELSLQNEVETKKLQAALKLLKDQYTAGTISLNEFNERAVPIKATLNDLRKSTLDTNRSLRNMQQEATSSEGSLEKLRAQLNLARQAFDKLSEADKRGSVGQSLLDNITLLNEGISKQEQATGRFQRNVGNYGSALKTLEQYLSDIRQELKATEGATKNAFTVSAPSSPSSGNVRTPGTGPRPGNDNAAREMVKYSTAVSQTSERVADLRVQEELLNRLVSNQATGFASATAQIKANEKALIDLESANLQNSGAYQLILKDTAELKDQLGDMKDEIAALASDTRGIDLLVSAISGLTAVAQVGATVYELYGGSAEDAQKSIQRLAAIQNVAAGIQTICNELTTKGTFLNKIYAFVMEGSTKATKANAAATAGQTAATVAQAAATNAASVATGRLALTMRVLRGALVASGIGLAIIAVIAIAEAVSDWMHADEELIKMQIRLNDTLAEQIRLQRDLSSLTKRDFATTTQNLKNNITYAQAYGKSQGEILAMEMELLRSQQALTTDDFFSTGGYKTLKDYEAKLGDVGKKYKDVLGETAKRPDDAALKLKKESIESELNLVKEQYTDQRKIVEDYVNNNIEINSKELQIARLNYDERLMLELTTQRIRANMIIDSNTRIIANERATEVERLASINKIAEAQASLADADFKSVKKNPSSSPAEVAAAQKVLSDQLRKIEAQRADDRDKTIREYAKREQTARTETIKERLRAEIEGFNQIIDNERKFYENRVKVMRLGDAAADEVEKQSFDRQLKALSDSFERQRALAEIEYQEQLQDETLTNRERIEITKRYGLQQKQLAIQFGIDQLSVYEDYQAKVTDLFEKESQRRIDIAYTKNAQEIKNLNEQLSRGSITRSKYERERARVESEARQAELKDIIRVETGKVILSKEGTAARAEAERKLAEATVAYQEEVLAKAKEGQDELARMKGELAGEVFNTLESITMSFYDKGNQKIQDQIDLVEKRKEQDIQFAEQTIQNEKQRAEAIKEIEVRAQAQREALEERQKQRDLSRARFEKNLNIAKIIGETALAVIHQLTVGDPATSFARSIAAAAIGSLRLAQAIAAPLPQYKHGKGPEDNYEGPAVWGDGGKSELRIREDGSMEVGPSTPAVTFVKKSDVILPDAKAFLSGNAATPQLKHMPQGATVESNNALISEMREMRKVMTKKKPIVVKGNHAGITVMHGYLHGWNEYIDQQTNF